MCTAATYKTKDFYFGRTLDYEFSYGEQIAVTPRNYPFHFRHMGDVANHYAIIGMAHVAADYPLYYDAVNEKGVGMAGLNFVGNAYFPEVTEGKENVASFEFIPWVLGQCANMKEVRELLAKINITGTPFAENMPAASLHWIIADADEAVTVESMRDGLKIYENPAGVMTNNPPFDQQMFLLNNYRGLSPTGRESRISTVRSRTVFPASVWSNLSATKRQRWTSSRRETAGLWIPRKSLIDIWERITPGWAYFPR